MEMVSTCYGIKSSSIDARSPHAGKLTFLRIIHFLIVRNALALQHVLLVLYEEHLLAFSVRCCYFVACLDMHLESIIGSTVILVVQGIHS